MEINLKKYSVSAINAKNLLVLRCDGGPILFVDAGFKCFKHGETLGSDLVEVCQLHPIELPIDISSYILGRTLILERYARYEVYNNKWHTGDI